jgi:hypothetical protein
MMPQEEKIKLVEKNNNFWAAYLLQKGNNLGFRYLNHDFVHI